MFLSHGSDTRISILHMPAHPNVALHSVLLWVLWVKPKILRYWPVKGVSVGLVFCMTVKASRKWYTGLGVSLIGTGHPVVCPVGPCRPVVNWKTVTYPPLVSFSWFFAELYLVTPRSCEQSLISEQTNATNKSFLCVTCVSNSLRQPGHLPTLPQVPSCTPRWWLKQEPFPFSLSC